MGVIVHTSFVTVESTRCNRVPRGIRWGRNPLQPNEDLESIDSRPNSDERTGTAHTRLSRRVLPFSPKKRVRPYTIVLALIACIVMLDTGLPTAAASSPGNPPPPPGVPKTNLDYVYNVTPALYPYPSRADNVSSPNPVSLVQLVSVPSLATPYGMINVSTTSTNMSHVWFGSGGYNPAIAQGIANGSCGDAVCSSIPVQWNSPQLIFSTTSPIVYAGVTSSGPNIYAVVSTASTTYALVSENEGVTWGTLGQSIAGVGSSVATNGTDVSILIHLGTTWSITTLNSTGSTLGSSTLTPSGSGSTGILTGSLTYLSNGTTSISVVAFSVSGSDQVQLASSSSPARGYSTPIEVATFQNSLANSALNTVGTTNLRFSNPVAGQVGLTAEGSELSLAFSSVSDSETYLETLGSSNGGSTWSQPSSSGPVVGTIDELTLTSSPADLVYAAWRGSTGVTGGVEAATFFPDGLPMVVPTELPGSSDPGISPTGGPSILVDSLQRPLIAWPSSSAEGNSVVETGAFFSPSESLALLNQVLSDPLGSGDFGSGQSQAAFNSSVASSMTTISNDLSSRSFCNAQNSTALSLYSEVTHIPLSAPGGTGTTCASLSVSRTSSPILNSSGPDAPNIYLAVYADWLLESEAVLLIPNAFGNGTTDWSPIADPVFGLSTTSSCSVGIVHSNGHSQSLSCFQYNDGLETLGTSEYSPTSFEVTPSVLMGTIPVMTWSFPNSCNSQGVVQNSTPSTYTIATKVLGWINVSIGNGPVHSFFSVGLSLPWLFITNLTPNKLYPYAATITMKLNQSTEGNWCGPSGGEPQFASSLTYGALWGSLKPETFTGAVKTTQTLWFPKYTLRTSSSSAASVYFSWRNALQATGSVQLQDLTTHQTWNWFSGAYSGTEKGTINFQASAGDSLKLTFSGTSRPGGWTPVEMPALANGTYGRSAIQTASVVFGGGGSGGNVTVPAPTVHLWSIGVSGITGTTAVVSWISNVNAGGYVTYSANNSGTTLYVQGLAGSVLSNGSAWQYTAELHGLEAWTAYTVAAGIFYSAAGETQNRSSSTWLMTSPVATVWEQDLPYDSISQTGGGAAIRWTTSPSFLIQDISPTVKSGTLWVWNATLSEVLPITASELNQSLNSPWNNWLNVTLSGFNQTYGFVLELNYSGLYAVTAESAPTYFTYQRDSSGDGLTDQEKGNGWYVCEYGLGWGLCETDAPDVYAFSSNGLINDFYEKKWSLDPYAIDTAGSGMLDAWNLTFDLGANSSNPSVPYSYTFDLTWEVNSSFDPFSYSQYPGGPNLHGTPLATDLNNISCTPRSCAGDSAYSAEVLWSSSALLSFEFMPGVDAERGMGIPLRAILGTCNGERTLTVWGKLSWGANPRTAVTPSGASSIDGQRISPLGTERLSVQVQNLYVAGLSSGEGYAARFALYSGRSGSGTPTLSNYSAPVGLNGGISRLTGYTVDLPVVQTSQYETLQLQILANESSNQPLTPIVFNGHANEINVTYDMIAGRFVALSYGASIGVHPNGSLSFSIQSITVGGKSPTFLWVPTQNGTTNGLPPGLERYTGEQSFDLVLVNASTSITSVGIPYPWGGSYTISLQQGLNNFLLPREQFLNSSFAEAILEGRNLPYPSSHPTPPVISGDSGAQSILTQSFGSAHGLMFDLQAYWQNRSIASGPGNFSSAETGISNANPLQVRTIVAQAANGTNTGGLFTDPALYSNNLTPPALQSILTLNITSQSTLDLLLAALLTNATAGVNGTLQTITSFVPSLGLGGVVASAVANAPFSGQGLFGPPPNNAPPPSSGGPWSDFVNGVTSISTTISGAIVSLKNIIWSATVAASTYLNHMAQEALAIGGQVLPRVAGALVSVGKAILSALDQVLNVIISVITAGLRWILEQISNAAASYVNVLDSSVEVAWTSISAGHQMNASEETSIGNALSGGPFVIATVLGVAVTVALTLLLPFDLGASFMVGLLLGLIVGVVLSALPSLSSGLAGFQASTVYDLEGIVNTTEANSTVKNPVNWETIAGVFGLVAATGNVPVALALQSRIFATSPGVSNQLAIPTLAFVMDLVAIVIGTIALIHSSIPVLILALAIGIVAAAVTLLHFVRLPVSQGLTSLKTLAYVDLGLSFAAVGSSAIALGIDFA